MAVAFGDVRAAGIEMPRARLNTPDVKTIEWKSQPLRAYQWRTLAADPLIARTYLAGTSTRRVRRALRALFGGTVGKDTMRRVWRKVKSDWNAWNAVRWRRSRSCGSFSTEPPCKCGSTKATSISLLVVIGVRSLRAIFLSGRVHRGAE